METFHKSVVSFLATQFNKLRHQVKWWIRREIVDNDPHDVDTLFPHDSQTFTDVEK